MAQVADAEEAPHGVRGRLERLRHRRLRPAPRHAGHGRLLRHRRTHLAALRAPGGAALLLPRLLPRRPSLRLHHSGLGHSKSRVEFAIEQDRRR